MEFIKKESWVVVYDILGFKNQIKKAEQELPRHVLFNRLSKLIKYSKEEANVAGFECILYADTFVFFAPDDEPISYSKLMLLSKQIITKSIYIRLPLCGAISVGPTYVAEGMPVFIGPAFLEAHEYCDAQDWIGLLLTPSATQRIRKAGLEPIRHDFVSRGICMKKTTLPIKDVLAYRFQNGAANFRSPLIRYLEEMEQLAPAYAKGKLRRTIDFIDQNYRYIKDEALGISRKLPE